MGLHVEPAYIGQAGYDHPVELDRNILEGIFGRTGVVRFGDFVISPGVGTRAVAVAAGRAVLVGTENAQQGAYFVWSDAVETFLLAAAVGNPRIDTIILRVVDDQYGVITGSPRAELEVYQGTPAGSPSALADSHFNSGGGGYKPGAWFRLGDVRVNTADTGSIPGGQFTVNLRYVRVNGKALCTSTTRPSDPAEGDEIYEVDTNRQLVWDSGPSAWTWNNARGIVGGQRYNDGTGTIIGGAGIGPSETLIGMSTGSITLEANRQFRIRWNVRALTATADNVEHIVRVRETNLAGAIRGSSSQAFGRTSATVTHIGESLYATGSSDETKTFVLTAQQSSGSANHYHSDDNAQGSFVVVEDMGPAGKIAVI